MSGEEKNVSDRLCIGEEHDKTVDADTYATCWRHPLADRFHEFFIQRVSLFIALFLLHCLLNEELALEFGSLSSE